MKFQELKEQLDGLSQTQLSREVMIATHKHSNNEWELTKYVGTLNTTDKPWKTQDTFLNNVFNDEDPVFVSYD